jgi:hypothetical protein
MNYNNSNYYANNPKISNNYKNYKNYPNLFLVVFKRPVHDIVLYNRSVYSPFSVYRNNIDMYTRLNLAKNEIFKLKNEIEYIHDEYHKYIGNLCLGDDIEYDGSDVSLLNQEYLLFRHSDIEKLRNGHAVDQQRVDKASRGFYLVMFNTLNHKEKLLVYNYINYNDMFLDSLINYLIINNKKLNRGIEPRFVDEYIIFIENTLSNVPDFRDESLNLKDGSKGMFDFFRDIIGTIHTRSIENLVDLLVLSYERDFGKFIEYLDFRGGKEYIKYYKSINNQDFSKLNIYNKCIFFVSDITKLKALLEEKGFTCNQGPQQFRGQINSMFSALSIIDKQFRDSMYNHVSFHHKIIYGYSMPKSKFSFKNVHINLGSSRFFSSSFKNKAN